MLGNFKYLIDVVIYGQINYTDQWKGQSDNGDELPSATYYYVMEFNNGNQNWLDLSNQKK
jgi:flagellar hook assembly protein FlgD